MAQSFHIFQFMGDKYNRLALLGKLSQGGK